MARSGALENRRHEPRQYLSKAPVAWRRDGATMWRRGWLNDISASGASLFVPTNGQVHAGQEINLRRRYSGETLLCRVVRTEIREDGQRLVACRVASAAGCPALLRPAPRAGTARQQAIRKAWASRLWTHSPHEVPRRRLA
jgi:hypothetical protein